LEQDRRAVAAQHGVAQAGLQSVPPGRQRAGDVAAVLIVHAKKRAKTVLLHHLARPLDAVVAQALPVDFLLPIGAGDTEIRDHRSSSQAHSAGAANSTIRLRRASFLAAGCPLRLSTAFEI